MFPLKEDHVNAFCESVEVVSAALEGANDVLLLGPGEIRRHESEFVNAVDSSGSGGLVLCERSDRTIACNGKREQDTHTRLPESHNS